MTHAAGQRSRQPVPAGAGRAGPRAAAGARIIRLGRSGRVRALAFACALGLAPVGCSRPPSGAAGQADTPPGSVRITLVHLNDVYEITSGPMGGGPARVATVRKRLEQENPNTLVILAGDFLSPSALGSARVDGERLDGRQMVDVMNAVGLDLATFGNHEFDLSEASLLGRLRESRFQWLTVNVSGPDGQLLPGTSRYVILRLGRGRDTARVAFFGVTMDRDQREHARVADPLETGIPYARMLRDSADVLVAVTHLPISQDEALAEAVPEIDLIVGGHEHENRLVHRGSDFTPIAKADANARTVWIHELLWDRASGRTTVSSRLVPLPDSVPEDAETRAVADRWVEAGFDGFRQLGFQPESVVANVPVPLDGLESSILNDTTTLTQLLAEAFRVEADAEAAVYNAGSIRIDDVLQPGPLTEYDLIRLLPFGGPVVEVEMRGSLLRRLLDQGVRNRGTGGFLQYAGITAMDGAWRVNGRVIEDTRMYRLAVGDFLLTGREQGLPWLTRAHPELRVLREHRDVRFALKDELQRRFGR